MSRRVKAVVIQLHGVEPEVWGNLKSACDFHGWKYNTLIKKDTPFDVGDFRVYRVPFRSCRKSQIREILTKKKKR